MPPPSYDDLRRFCELDGWEELSRVRGGTGDHRRYRNVLPDGTILRTKVSHGKGEIGDPGLWRRIWREQLGLASEEEFWRALRQGRGVDRGGVSQSPPAGPSIPGWVVDGLRRAAVDEADLQGLTAEEARRRLEDIWAQPRDEPVD